MRVGVLILTQGGLLPVFVFPQKTLQCHGRQRNNLQFLVHQLKAEYRAIVATASELIWMTQLLKDFGVSVPPSAFLSCDNQAIIHITTNPTFHERTKHKEIDCYFVHDQVTVRLLKLMPVRTHHQLADIFTKLLPSSLLLPHLSKKAV